MKRFRHRRFMRFFGPALTALLLALTFIPCASTQTPEITPDQSIIQPDWLRTPETTSEQTSTPQDSTPTPEATIEETGPDEPQPLAFGWKIAIAVAVTAAVATGLYFSIRTWRSSNLFDRQYIFPPVEKAAFRLGGTKSGGCMAMIVFSGASAGRAQVRSQTPGETPPR